jgi:hypothetical protein
LGYGSTFRGKCSVAGACCFWAKKDKEVLAFVHYAKKYFCPGPKWLGLNLILALFLKQQSSFMPL